MGGGKYKARGRGLVGGKGGVGGRRAQMASRLVRGVLLWGNAESSARLMSARRCRARDVTCQQEGRAGLLRVRNFGSVATTLTVTHCRLERALLYHSQ